jgi:DUF4097 and DUF4098 domain-containing protein YvlB
MRCCTLIAALAFTGTALAAPPDVSQVNGGIVIEAHRQAGNVSSTNGSIEIGAGASVADVHSVNGGISLADGANAAAAKTVNGGIHLQRDVRLSGGVTTVNGAITLGPRTDVAGSVSSVNGAVQLTAARAQSVTTVNGAVILESAANISGRVSTVNGAVGVAGSHVGGGIETVEHGMNIGANSRVEGGILVRKRERRALETWLRAWFPEHYPPPRIVIGPGAVVSGTLRFQCPVTLYVSDRAHIGSVEGATAIVFSGEQPPA